MVGGAARLGEVEPRERAGAQTGRKYEYQYERTARASLDLLIDSCKQVCVYCDWRDDYVAEVGDPPTRYVFHRRKSSSNVNSLKLRSYDRILKNIRGARMTIHCTITAQVAERPGYLDEFLRFWTSQQEVTKVWFSLFTPQRGAEDPEILTPKQRASTIAQLQQLRLKYSTLDMSDALIPEMNSPPNNPQECIFARTTETISADLRTAITPCQFGGKPDCERCGCIASMGLAAVGHHRVLGRLEAGSIFMASDRMGKSWLNFRRRLSSGSMDQPKLSPFNILEP
jgi:hypothetical protein